MSENAPAAPPPPSNPSEASAGDQRPTSDAPADGQQAPAWKPPKLKVYNREIEVDEPTYHKHAQTGAAFAEQSRQISQRRAELDAREAQYANAVPVERLRADPAAVFKELGIDPLKWSAEQLVSTHEAETLPPEQKALQDREAAVAAKEKEFQDREQRAEQERLNAATQQRRAALGERYVSALKTAGVPEGPASWPLLKSIVDYQGDLDSLVERGVVTPEEAAQRGTPEALAQLAMDDVRQKDAATWGSLSGDDLLWAIPREVGDRYVEARVLQHEAARAGGGAPVPMVARPSAAPGRQQAPTGNGATGGERLADGTFTTREHREFMDRLGLNGG